MDNEHFVVDRWREVCMVKGCGRGPCVAGYCPRHYQQIRRHGRLTPEREYHKRGERCMVEGCRDQQVAKGYCFRHYQQVRRYGRLTPERERLYGRLSCRIPGCEEKHSSKGYCKRHYMSHYYTDRQHPLAIFETPADRAKDGATSGEFRPMD